MYDKKTGHPTPIAFVLASHFVCAKFPKASLWEPKFNVGLLIVVYFEMTKIIDTPRDPARLHNIDLGSAEGTDRSGVLTVVSILIGVAA